MKYTKWDIAEILKRHKDEALFPEMANIKKSAQHECFRDEVEKLRKIADEAIENPSRILPFTAYVNHLDNDLKDKYGTEYMKNRMKYNALAFMAILTDDEKYIKALEEEIWILLNSFSWVTPGGVSTFDPLDGRDGVPIERMLDLTSTETAFTLAETDAILGDKLNPFLRYHMKKEVMERVIDSYDNPSYIAWWESCEHNWAAVCTFSVAGAAMYYLKDDIARLSEIIHRSLATMDLFLRGYGDDGACVEGASYWAYGFSNYMFFAELLKEKTGGEITLTDDEKVREIAYYLHRARTVGNKCINFEDSADSFSYRICLLHKLKSIFPDVTVPDIKYAMRYHSDHCYRWAGFIRDYTWFNEEALSNEDTYVENHFFKDAQIYISHKADCCFAVTGGNNGYNHNHNDLGHFIYFKNGEDIFIDLGQGRYVTGYFDMRYRYTHLNAGSQGHSVPVIGEELQKHGTERCVTYMDVKNGEADVVEMELENAYALDILKSLKRRFEFKNDGTLTMSDTFDLTKAEDITEAFVVQTSSEPEFGDGFVVLEKNGVSVKLSYDKAFTEHELVKIPADLTPLRPKEGRYIIKLKAKNTQPKTEYVFEII